MKKPIHRFDLTTKAARFFPAAFSLTFSDR